ncbi:Hypothetical protein FKW44_001547 [Caligus rogercresseyi]|uniref:Uncharacterized protein n=1 Tax=Caligus rogercresseyi TaxID=217165 RepID=A0A7T8KIY2_CALRO|nr:Hypothetical protein FKW44_001547 [Caligus rogercresseyi]
MAIYSCYLERARTQVCCYPDYLYKGNTISNTQVSELLGIDRIRVLSSGCS